MRACIVGCGKQCGWTSGNVSRYFDGIDWVDKSIESAIHFYNLHSSIRDNSTYGNKVITNVDLGIILTPNNIRREVAEPFIENNIPIFIEKPLTLSWKELEWFEQAEKNGAWITTGFNCRFKNSIQSIKAEIEVNPPIIIDCWKHRQVPKGYYSDWHGKWKSDGGTITQQGIHAIDLVCFVTGEVPETISMIGGKFKHELECEDTAILNLKYKDFLATIHITTAMGAGGNMYGGHSGLLVSTKYGGFCLAQGFSFEEITAWKNMKSHNLMQNYSDYMWDHIINALKNKNPPPVPVSEAIKSMKIAHAGYASWSDGGKPKSYGTKFPLLGT